MNKRFLTKRWSLRLITVVGLVCVMFIAMGVIREIASRYFVNQEITKVQAEIDSLERKNKELAGLVEYLNTDAFKEIQARQNLGVQKEGEIAVSIESLPNNVNNEVEMINDDDKEEGRSNVEKWWDYFFTK